MVESKLTSLVLSFSKDHSEEIESKFPSLCLLVSDYPTGTFSYLGPAIESLLGYKRDLYLEGGVDFNFSLPHPEDLARISAEIAGHLLEMASEHFDSDKMHSYRFLGRFKHAEGHMVWLEQDAYMGSFDKQKRIPGCFFTLAKEVSAEIASEEFLWNEPLKRETNPHKVKELREQYNRIKSIATPSCNTAKDIFVITLCTRPYHRITDREREVLKLLSHGFATKEIVDKLHISFHTAEAHRKHLIDKFEGKNTAELIKEVGKNYCLSSVN